MDLKRKSIRAKMGAEIEIEAVKTKDRERKLFITRDCNHLKLLNVNNLEYHPLAEMNNHPKVTKSFYHNFNEDSLQLCLLYHNVADDSLKYHFVTYSL